MKYVKITHDASGLTIDTRPYESYLNQVYKDMPAGFRALSEDVDANFSLNGKQSRHDRLMQAIQIAGTSLDKIVLKIKMQNSRTMTLTYHDAGRLILNAKTKASPPHSKTTSFPTKSGHPPGPGSGFMNLKCFIPE